MGSKFRAEMYPKRGEPRYKLQRTHTDYRLRRDFKQS